MRWSRSCNTLQLALAGAAVLVMLLSPVAARAQQADNRWAFSVTPYLWLPSIGGTLRYSVPPGAAGSPDVKVGVDDYLSHLDMALMLSGEARKGRWSVFTDVIYLDFSGESSAVKAINFGGPRVGTDLNTSTSSSLKGMTWTLGAGYALLQTPTANLDVFGGLRYFGLETSTDWQLNAAVTGPQGGTQVFPRSGSITQREDLWDALVGLRGRVRFGEGNWFMPYYVDVGTGSSAVTWQGLVGIGYGFKWGEVLLAYRHLYYEQSGDKLVQDLHFSGPGLGVTFRF